MARRFAEKRERGLGLVGVVTIISIAASAHVMAETTAQDFLHVAPLPEGTETAEPIPDAVNVRFQDCEAVWPEGYRDWLAESVAAEGHARKRDIYSWLRARQAFEAKDCGCTGKVASWDEVEHVYAALRDTHGRVLIRHTAEYAAQADILTAAVERMCGGPF